MSAFDHAAYARHPQISLGEPSTGQKNSKIAPNYARFVKNGPEKLTEAKNIQ